METNTLIILMYCGFSYLFMLTESFRASKHFGVLCGLGVYTFAPITMPFFLGAVVSTELN